MARHPMLRTVFPAGTRPAIQQELPPSLRLPVDFETLTDPHDVETRVAAERTRRFEPWPGHCCACAYSPSPPTNTSSWSTPTTSSATDTARHS
ncbi:hypothetical protein [Kitasatospora albolonga]|uniref:hypothetical protein n=1 Tax=Kitasatospora albolonga TaxID=68173 RepID=UPI0039BD41D3